MGGRPPFPRNDQTGPLRQRDRPVRVKRSLTIDRLVAFAATRPISHILGCHIEMTISSGVDYPVRTTYQPDERHLQMTTPQLTDIQAAVRQVHGRPGRHVFPDFILDAGAD